MDELCRDWGYVIGYLHSADREIEGRSAAPPTRAASCARVWEDVLQQKGQTSRSVQHSFAGKATEFPVQRMWSSEHLCSVLREAAVEKAAGNSR